MRNLNNPNGNKNMGCDDCFLDFLQSFSGSIAPSLSSESESSTDSSHQSEEEAVVHAIVDDAEKIHADDDADPFEHVDDAVVVHDDAAPVGLGVNIHAEPPAVPPVGVPMVAAPDPVPPAWDVGAQKAEVARTGKATCMVCKLSCEKGLVRIAYRKFKSQFLYVHPGCLKDTPNEYHPHSVATLRFQKDWMAGHDAVLLHDAIEAIIPTLV